MLLYDNCVQKKCTQRSHKPGRSFGPSSHLYILTKTTPAVNSPPPKPPKCVPRRLRPACAWFAVDSPRHAGRSLPRHTRICLINFLDNFKVLCFPGPFWAGPRSYGQYTCCILGSNIYVADLRACTKGLNRAWQYHPSCFPLPPFFLFISEGRSVKSKPDQPLSEHVTSERRLFTNWLVTKQSAWQALLVLIRYNGCLTEPQYSTLHIQTCFFKLVTLLLVFLKKICG